MSPTPRKSAPRKAPAKKAAATPRAAQAKQKAAAPKHTTPVYMTREERWRMVAEAAYHKAEKRGFAPGHEKDDWLAAEREIDALFGGKK